MIKLKCSFYRFQVFETSSENTEKDLGHYIPHILPHNPSKASTSFIRCPLPIPPNEGLHDISPEKVFLCCILFVYLRFLQYQFSCRRCKFSYL